MCQPFLATLLGLHKVLYSCSVYAVLSLQSVLLLLQPFYGPLSGTTRVSRYQKRHSPTHHPDHHPVFISIFHTLRSIASSLFILSAWESFCTTSVQLCPSPLWSTSWPGALYFILNTLHPVSVFFSQHMPKDAFCLAFPTSCLHRHVGAPTGWYPTIVFLPAIFFWVLWCKGI